MNKNIDMNNAKRELLRLLKTRIKRYNGRGVVYRAEKVCYASDSVGSTFWSASKSAAMTYGAGGYGFLTQAEFFIGDHVFFKERLSVEFYNFTDQLAAFAIRNGCKLEYATSKEWSNSADAFRISYPGDFYTHCVDKLINAKIWPKGIKYTILGDNWDIGASTHEAAELIVHNRVQLVKYTQEGSPIIRSKVDCRRMPTASVNSDSSVWNKEGYSENPWTTTEGSDETI